MSKIKSMLYSRNRKAVRTIIKNIGGKWND